MTEIKTKIKWKGILLIFSQFIFVGYIIVLDFFFYKLAKITKDYYYFTSLILFMTAFLYLIFKNVIKKTLNNVTYVTINKDGIKIQRPLKFFSRHYEWNQIKGFSKTDYVYIGGKFSYSCKAIIIYTKSGLTYEIVEIYNSNYLNFQKYLHKFKVVYFGTEKYERGRFGKRKNYKYLNLYNN